MYAWTGYGSYWMTCLAVLTLPRWVITKEILFQFYKKWYENGYSGSILLMCITAHYPNIKWSILSNHTVNPTMLNLLLWPGPDTIINICDPMQNPGQTQIFYTLGQTYSSWTKLDLDDLNQFQTWFMWVYMSFEYTVHYTVAIVCDNDH